MTRTRIGLVGAGLMAETHLARFAAMDGATVTAVCSPSSAPAFVERHGLDATAYTDAAAFFEHDLDAVDVCSPTGTHAEYAIEAADRGLDVFCEKPLALTVASANRIRDAVADAGITLMVGHVVRFFNAYAAVNERVAAGEIGRVATARARRHVPFPGWGEWYADDDRTGGVFHDLAIHDFDYLRTTVGEVDRVFARRARWSGGQTGHALLRFTDGARAHVDVGWDRPADAGLRSTLELVGDAGVIEYDSEDSTGLELTAGPDAPAPDPAVERDGYRRELDAFLAAVEGGEAPVGVEDAIASMRVSLAATASADRGEPVAIEEVPP